MTEYVQGYRADDGSVEMEHLDGVEWYDAPVPRRWHRCWAQTRGFINFNYIERCACGAIRMRSRGPWIHKNEKRKA